MKTTRGKGTGSDVTGRPTDETRKDETTKDKSRRNLLRALAGGSAAITAANLPGNWARPIATAVSVPVHASTTGCVAAPGCYFIPQFEASLSWSGGFGPTLTEFFPLSNDCVEGQIPTFEDIIVVASSAQEAALLCGSEVKEISGDDVKEFPPTDPPLPSGCRFYGCRPPQVEENCIRSTMPVLMADGVLRRVDTLVPGDLVHSNGDSRIAVVTHVIREHLRADFYRINGELEITGDHPVLCEGARGREWRTVSTLAVGDAIVGVHDSIRIASITHHQTPTHTVYVETNTGNFVAALGNARYVIKSRYGRRQREGVAITTARARDREVIMPV